MKKVLVVDDSKTIRTICEWIYKNLEDRVITADSAASARQLIQSESPDIVVVDYTLPDMDAYEFVSSIKDKARVVMMGGTYAAFDVDKAMASGAVKTLMKPFKTADFFALMDAAMSELLPEASASAPVETAETAQAVSVPSVPPMPAAPPMHVAPPMAAALSDKPRSSVSSPAVPSIGAAAMAPAVAPISAHVSHGADAVPPISSHAAPLGVKPASGLQPAVAPRRFNFPGSNSAVMEPPKAPESGTPAKVTSGISPIPATASSEVPAAARSVEHSTPKTPVPSISPAVQQSAVQPPPAAPAAQNVQIDPAVLRAEVIAAVKSMLPAIVNSYLKKLIQAEVKPQLQNWVDARVEALVKKMMQQ